MWDQHVSCLFFKRILLLWQSCLSSSSFYWRKPWNGRLNSAVSQSSNYSEQSGNLWPVSKPQGLSHEIGGSVFPRPLTFCVMKHRRIYSLNSFFFTWCGIWKYVNILIPYLFIPTLRKQCLVPRLQARRGFCSSQSWWYSTNFLVQGWGLLLTHSLPRCQSNYHLLVSAGEAATVKNQSIKQDLVIWQLHWAALKLCLAWCPVSNSEWSAEMRVLFPVQFLDLFLA